MVKPPVKIKSKSKVKRKSRKKLLWNKKIWFMKGKWWVISGTITVVILVAILVSVGAVISFGKKQEMSDNYDQLEIAHENLYGVDYAATKSEARKIEGKIRDAENSFRLSENKGIFCDVYSELDSLLNYLKAKKFGKECTKYFNLVSENNSLVSRYNDTVDKMNDIRYANAQYWSYKNQLNSWDEELKRQELEIENLKSKLGKMQNHIASSLWSVNGSLNILENRLRDMNLWGFLWAEY